MSSCFLRQPSKHHHHADTEHASPAPADWYRPSIKALRLLPLLILFLKRAPLSLSCSEVNSIEDVFRKAHDAHVLVVVQTLPQTTRLLLLIAPAKASSDNMPQGCWFLAVLLALGCTSGPCRAGPLHAQCKVEWYLFFLYIL